MLFSFSKVEKLFLQGKEKRSLILQVSNDLLKQYLATLMIHSNPY